MHYRYLGLLLSVCLASSLAANKKIEQQQMEDLMIAGGLFMSYVMEQLPDDVMSIDRIKEFERFNKLPDDHWEKRLEKAIKNGSTHDIKMLAKAGYDLNREIRCKKPIVLAVMYDQLESMKALVECGVDYNVIREEYLGNKQRKQVKFHHWLIKSQNPKFAKYILAKSGDFSLPQDKKLQLECAYSIFGKPDLLELYIQHGFDVTPYLDYLSLWALKTESFLVLVEKAGVDPNITFKNCGNQRTMLSEILVHNDYEATKRILDAGADPNKRFADYYYGTMITPLGWVKKSPVLRIDMCKIIDLLIEYGAHS